MPTNRLWTSVLLLAALLQTGTAAQGARPGQGPVTVEVKGPIVLGFFPPFTKAEEDADDGGITEGLAHVRFALEDIAKCYANTAAVYRLAITRSITLRDGRRVHRITIPADWGHAVGIIVAMPGRQPHTVFAQGEPSSLAVIGPSTAAEYFGARACRPV